MAGTVSAEKLLSWRMKESLSEMTEEHPPAIIEKIQAKDFPTRLPLAATSTPGHFTCSLPLRKVFSSVLLFLLDGCLFCF